MTSSVTVLGSDDPVRVWEQFATLDQFSGGRAEIIAGRGSYTESFPLFGLDPRDHADLFRENLDLLLKIREQDPLTWKGRFRPALEHADIGPRSPREELPIWVGVGGTQASAISTGRLGLPMALALLLGPITHHVPTIDLYRQAAAQAGHDPSTLRTSINLHGYVGRTSQGARDTMYPYFARGMMDNNHQRGRGFQMSRAVFDAQTSPSAGLVVGSPQEVIDKLLAYHEICGLDRQERRLPARAGLHRRHRARRGRPRGRRGPEPDGAGRPGDRRHARVPRVLQRPVQALLRPGRSVRAREQARLPLRRRRRRAPRLGPGARAATLVRVLPVDDRAGRRVRASSGDFDGVNLLSPRVHGRIEMAVADVVDVLTTRASAA